MKFAQTRSLYYLSILFLLLSMTACSTTHPTLDKKTESVVPGNEKPCSVAFLPFFNDSPYDQGGLIMQRVFAAELGRLAGTDISSDADVQTVFSEQHIFPKQAPNIEQIRILGSRLGVQRIISGRVLEMEEIAGEQYVIPKLTLTLQVYDAATGKLLWTTYHRRAGDDYRKIMHFGLVNTVTQLSRIMSDEIIQEWLTEGMQQCGN